ncbi:MAG TPA: hypothetical protein ENJ11_05875 [Gammaproteobacteria bacterium]|nr:hypothetical protein [Gammaproteobacteria bacterium]
MLSAVTIDEYESLLLALQNVLGIVVPDARRSQLLERLQGVLDEFQLDSMNALARALENNVQAGAVRARVLDAVSRPQSEWVLPPEISSVLNKYAFAQIPDNGHIWLVGCGQGQLAYALAMELAEYEQKTGDKKQLDILATDSMATDIKQAETAAYTAQEIASLRENYRENYLLPENNERWLVKDKIRQRVHFSQCDLMQDFQSLGEMDLIICPTVLVYFSNGVKAHILSQFSSMLKPGGMFLAGLNQAIIPFNQDFERVEHPAGVFYRRKA